MSLIPWRRYTARALPIDPTGRVLLLHGFDPARPDTSFWFTIGGALEDGETMQQAAAREMHEEVGIAVEPGDFIGPLETSTVEFSFGRYAIVQDQTFFAVHVAETVVSFDHMEEIEKQTTTEFRWWDVTDLDSALPDLARVVRKVV